VCGEKIPLGGSDGKPEAEDTEITKRDVLRSQSLNQDAQAAGQKGKASVVSEQRPRESLLGVAAGSNVFKVSFVD
jgi:hypothetical protein